MLDGAAPPCTILESIDKLTEDANFHIWAKLYKNSFMLGLSDVVRLVETDAIGV